MLLGLLLLAFGCPYGQNDDQPGEPVGKFQAEGVLVIQSCGAAIPSPDPIGLDFELRSESNGRAYWHRDPGQTFAGIEEDDTYTFQIGQSWTVVEPDYAQGYAGCSVTQVDVFEFEVETAEVPPVADAGIEDESGVETRVEPKVLTLRGSQITEIVPVSGSDCIPALNIQGGFYALPCRVEYLLSGTGIGVEEAPAQDANP